LSPRTLNLGILAHVDAGKTTLTERLLYAAGVIDEPGSVDAGTTQTDSLELERQRGITIRAAVASFAVGDLTINLIDTPGHPDFIAEVERALGALDAVVLLLSAVEGVQPQTRVLMRASQRLHLPTLLFVNKIDRTGASVDRTLDAIRRRLAVAAVALQTVDDEGSPTATVHPLDGVAIDPHGAMQPVLFGSAITGAGIELLMQAFGKLLPAASSDERAPLRATVFKIERTQRGDRVAYARIFDGRIRVRDRIGFAAGKRGKVVRLEVFDGGPAAPRPVAAAGSVVKLWGLTGIRVGDHIGDPAGDTSYRFPQPMLVSVVVPDDPDDGARLRTALTQLAEQDPLINVHQDQRTDEFSVSLYGDVQRQVLEATLLADYGIAVTSHQATPLCRERPRRPGAWTEVLHAASNPYSATVGFRIEPAPDESGIEVRVPIEHSDIPLIVYKRRELFVAAITDYVTETLQEGLHGWAVADCLVTMTRCGYSVADGPPSRRGPTSTAADFRKLTPLVLRRALERAGTVVCQPVVRATLELPGDAVASTTAAIARLGGALHTAGARADLVTLETVISTTAAQRLRQQLPELTGGEGTMETSYAGHAPVAAG